MASSSSPSDKKDRRRRPRREDPARKTVGGDAPKERGAGRPEGRRGAPDQHTPRQPRWPGRGSESREARRPSAGGRTRPGARASGHAGETFQEWRLESPAEGGDFAFVYGRNPVREALRGRRTVHALWLASGQAADDLERRVSEWLDAASPEVRPTIHHLPPLELNALLGTVDHQGIGAEVDPYPYVDLAHVLVSHTLLVALDQIQDPHNLGAIIRTAEGAGAAVLIPRHRAAEITAAVVKASAGATEHAAVVQVRNLADALAQAKEAGFWIYGAAAEAAAPYTAQDYTYPTCFVVGSEGEGLGRRVAAACDVAVALPLAGRMESLNVSVSAGILLYEAVRQRAGAPCMGAGAAGSEVQLAGPALAVAPEESPEEPVR